ncbi:MAG: ABC transporter permease [Oscillospiraceae bacterium]|nr:ABC transporter permease [Oscillospiraceae bacterium]
MSNLVLLLVGTLMYTTPLLFAALGGVISELSGVMNIGLEGIMTFGAFTAAAVSFFSGNPFLGFFAAGLAGALLISLHAVASITFRADQTISGTAINFLGAGISVLLTKKFFHTSTSPSAPKLPSVFPKWITHHFERTTFQTLKSISIATLLAFIFVYLLYFILYKTSWGLRILATGEHPAAVDTLGISVPKVRYFCVLASGMLAGFGGAFVSISVTSSFSSIVICGQGFIALAAMIFGKWTPHGAMLSCLLFGFARECTTLFEKEGGLIPPSLLETLPYILTLMALILFVGKSAMPKADGIPYI